MIAASSPIASDIPMTQGTWAMRAWAWTFAVARIQDHDHDAGTAARNDLRENIRAHAQSAAVVVGLKAQPLVAIPVPAEVEDLRGVLVREWSKSSGRAAQYDRNRI